VLVGYRDRAAECWWAVATATYRSWI